MNPIVTTSQDNTPTTSTPSPTLSSSLKSPLGVILTKSTSMTQGQGFNLLNKVIELSQYLINSASRNEKFLKLKGNEELILRLEETNSELTDKKDKIDYVLNQSTKIHKDLCLLHQVLEDIDSFLEEVKASGMFTSKSKLKSRLVYLYQTLRSHCTQFLTTLSLLLLSDQEPIKEGSAIEHYHNGLAYFYGHFGKSVNYSRAFDEFYKAAELNDESSMIFLAKCYQNGWGTDLNIDLALKWFEASSKTGSKVTGKAELAIFVMNQLKKISPSIFKDYFDSIKKYSVPPKKPSKPDLHIKSVSRYINEEVDSPSLTEIKRSESPTLVHSRLEELNNEYNDFHPATFRNYDLNFVIKTLLSAAVDGYSYAKTQLGVIYEEGNDIEKAIKFYSEASNSGCSEGSTKLGYIYLYSSDKLAISNQHKAFKLFSLAVRNSNLDTAWNGLGICYEFGIGTDINILKAIECYRKGVTYYLAMYNLGSILIRNSLEITKNLEKNSFISNNKFLNTGENDNKVAYLELSIKANEYLKEGIHWLRAAAENNYSDAFYQLGRLYEQGIGVPIDPFAALDNYKCAAKFDHPIAAYYAGHLLYNMVKLRKEEVGSINCSLTDSKIFEPNSFSYFSSSPVTRYSQFNQYSDAVLLEESSYYYQKAIKKDLPEAMNAFGLLLEDGVVYKNSEIFKYIINNNDSVLNVSNTNIVEKQKFYELAGAYYFESCLRGYSDAFLNLAYLLAYNYPLNLSVSNKISSTFSTTALFRTLNGEILSFFDMVKFLDTRFPYSDYSREKIDTYKEFIQEILTRCSTIQPTSHISPESSPYKKLSSYIPQKEVEESQQHLINFIDLRSRRSDLTLNKEAEKIDQSPMGISKAPRKVRTPVKGESSSNFRNL